MNEHLSINRITDADHLRRIKKALEQECRPWLDQVDWTPVYRGIHPDRVPFHLAIFSRPIRTDRHPKDTTRDIHDALDLIMTENGLVATRSNSMFVTGHKSNAASYGKIYYVLPIGPFHYTWSSRYFDTFTDVPRTKYLKVADGLQSRQVVRNFFGAQIKDLTDDIRDYQQRIRVLQSESQTNPKANSAIASYEAIVEKRQKEIERLKDHSRLSFDMLRSVYPEIVNSVPPHEKILDVDRLKHDLKDVYQGDNDSLLQAIHSGHEIMINAQAAYYIIPDVYWKLVKA